MISGRDVLHRIDESIATARTNLANVNRAAGERARRLSEVERAERDAYRAIAAIRLDHLQSDDLAGSLSAADREATQLLDSHDDRLADLGRQVETAQAAIASLETDRRAHEAALEKAVAAHEDAVNKTNARLQTDPAYQDLLCARDEAYAVAERSAAKLEIAKADRLEKGEPFEADPFFSYLWERRFGERDYKAAPPFAAMDGWVAGLIDYRKAKLNYARLIELPTRLEEHLARVEDTADQFDKDAGAYERAALEADGVAKLRDAASESAAALKAIDAQITEAEARHHRLANEHAETADGRAGPIGEARDKLAKALAGKTIPDLKLLAAETLTLEDDRLVDELMRLKLERLEIEDAGPSMKRTVSQHHNILTDLESLRRRFKSSRLDHPFVEFSNSSEVEIVLAELLRGALNDRRALNRLERTHKRHRNDWSSDFGGPEWRGDFGSELPHPPGLPRPPRLPRSPRLARALRDAQTRYEE